MNRYIVYGLYDHMNILFYVGVTMQNPRVRLLDHINCTKQLEKSNRRLKQKHVRIIESGYMVYLREIDAFTSNKEAALIREMYWIQHFRDLGIKLTNQVIWNRKCYNLSDPKSIDQIVLEENNKRTFNRIRKINIPNFESAPFNFAIKVKHPKKLIGEYLSANFKGHKWIISKRDGYCYVYKIQ